MNSLIAQTPTTAPPSDGSWNPIENPVAGGAGLALLLLLLAGLGLRVRKASRKIEAPPPPGAAAPPVKIELPPSELEAQRLRDAEEAHGRAESLSRERAEREAEARTRAAEGEERGRLEAEAQALKAREEEAKRERYRAEKEAEREARQRRQREREEAERLQREAEAQARAEEEARARAVEEEAKRKAEAESGRTLADGLDRTRTQGFMARLNSMFGAPKQIDEGVLGELEELLFTADIGVKTASHLVESAREKVKRKELSSSDKIKDAIRIDVERMIDLPQSDSASSRTTPHVVMVVGVNGAGKTTTIGKLAAQMVGEGKRVVLAAGDTFRAAAAEQLEVWAERAGAILVKGRENADPASVIFDAIGRALQDKADVVIADTAGRLHTLAPLMEELKKVKRVMGKALPGAPHEVLLVLDSTNGQNAIHQAKQFHDALGVTGIALTKLDGTAKGGVIIGICDELKIPVAWVGIGEKIPDLRRFEPREFVQALFA